MIEAIYWLLPYFLLSALVGILAGLIGSVVYHRNFSNLVGGLSHFLLGPIAISLYIEYIFEIPINPYFFSAIIAVCTIILVPLNKNGEIKQSQHINVLWSLGMALGVTFLYSSPNVTNLDFFLFGNIITITKENIYFLVILTMVIILFFIIFYTKIVYLGLDDTFLQVKGINTLLFHKLLLVMVTLGVVLLLQIVGVLLLLTIVTLPALISSLYVKSYKGLLVYSICISVIGLCIAVLFSFLFNVPVSSFASLVFCILFFVCKGVAMLVSR